MCIQALPKRLRSIGAWKGTDQDKWWNKWFLSFKLNHCVFGPRDSHTWHQWRQWPIVLLGKGSKDAWRMENDFIDYEKVILKVSHLEYLSRIQYWKRWHFQIQWPFMIAFHFYFKSKNVPVYPNHSDLDGKLFYCYLGCHRDADRVYWCPSAFIGLCWK